MTALGTVIAKGLLSARPAASIAGMLYFGTDTSTLYRDNGSSWDTIATSGMADVTTTRGDLIRRGAAAVERLALGAAGKILTSDGTDAVWGNGPITTRGDLLSGGVAGAIQRLALGTVRQALLSDGTDAVWGTVKPDDLESFLSSDLTCVNASTLYSAATMAVTPPAGDWEIKAELSATSASSSPTGISAFLATGGSLASNVLSGHTALTSKTDYNPGSNAGGQKTIPISARVTGLDGSTPVRLVGQSVRGSSDTVIKTTGIESGAVANKVTLISAIRVSNQ